MTQINICNNPIRKKESFLTGDMIYDSVLLKGFDMSICCCIYEGYAREMVHRLKYNGKIPIAQSMAVMMFDVIKKEKLDFDIIVPVPVHKNRLKKRGYNQSYLISKELSNLTNKPSMDILKRIKDTPSQILFNSEDRWYNVKDAFVCTAPLNKKAVLLVDDVVTTGATVSFCAGCLKSSGALSVKVISFARAY